MTIAACEECETFIFLPGHKDVQSDFWSASPMHVLPPFKGAGLVHNLDLCWEPRPHRTVHSDQGLHVDQPPLTEKEESCELNGYWTQKMFSML